MGFRQLAWFQPAVPDRSVDDDGAMNRDGQFLAIGGAGCRSDIGPDSNERPSVDAPPGEALDER